MAISITKPIVGGSEDTWGTTINEALDTLVDAANGAAGAISPDLSTLTINGTDVTATAAELNVLDGVTATTAELNILDGVTATTAEINYVDGVTSSIQTQLNGKASDATQANAAWEAGTSTTEGVVSPAKVKAAIESLSSFSGQGWQNVTGSRAFNTSYQNSNGSAIQVSVYASADDIATGLAPVTGSIRFQVSTDNSTWVDAAHGFLERTGTAGSYVRAYNSCVIVPDNHYYRLYTTAGSQNLYSWAELK